MNSSEVFEKDNYISAKKAAKKFSFSSDYIGQLCRSQKVVCKRVGKSWYVSEESLIDYIYHNSTSSRIDKFSTVLNKKNNSPKVSNISKKEIPTIDNTKDKIISSAYIHYPLVLSNTTGVMKDHGGSVYFDVFKKVVFGVFTFVLFFNLTIASSGFIYESIKKIPQSPKIIYNTSKELTDFWANSLSSKYILVGNKIYSSLNSFKDSFDYCKYKVSYCGEVAFKETVLLEKRVLDKSGDFVASLLNNTNSTDSLLASVSSYDQNYNSVDKTGVQVYKTINSLFDKSGSLITNLFGKKQVVVINNIYNQASTTSNIENKKDLNNQNQNQKTIIEQRTKVVYEYLPAPKTNSLTVNNLPEAYEKRLQEVNNSLLSRMSQLSTGSGGNITNVYQQIANSQRIDNLSGTNISNASISGGTISGASISGGSLSLDSASLGTTTLNNLTVSNTSTSTFNGGLNVLYLNITGTSATSTFANGIDITDGCFAVDGICLSLGGGGGSGTVNSGTVGQVPYYSSNGTTLSATSTIFISSDQKIGIGTTSPYAKLSVVGEIVGAYFTATTSATSTFTGGLSTNLLNVTSSSATSTFANGIRISSGCFQLPDGTCAGTGGGGLSSYDAWTHPSYGGSATTSLITLSNGFLSTASSTIVGNSTTTGTLGAGRLFINSDYITDLTGTGLALSGGALVTSNVPNSALQNSTISGIALGSNLADLTATDSTLTFSGTYNGGTARTIGLNLGNANTWTVNQTFNYSSSTAYSSFITSSTTNLLAGNITLSTTTAGTLKTNSSGLVYIDTVGGSSASSTLLADSNTFSGTNNFTAKLGLATTTPYAKLSVNSIAGEPAFVVGSSTATSLIVDSLGRVGLGTTTPFGLLSLQRPSGSGTTNSLVIASSTGLTSYTIDSTGRSRYYTSAGATSDSLSIGSYTSSPIAGIKFLTIGSNGFNRGTGSLASGIALREDTHQFYINYPWESYSSYVNDSEATGFNIGNYNNSFGTTLALYNWGSVSVGYGSGIMFAINTNSGSPTKTNIGKIGFVSTDVGASTYRGDLTLSTSIGANPVEKARLTSTGYLGIGTTTPAWMLQVATSTNSIAKAMFALSDTGAGTNLKHWTLSSQGGNFYIASSSDVYATTSISALEISGSGFGTTTIRGLNILGQATSTSNVGLAFSSGGVDTNYLFGAGLSSCIGANKLLWSGGTFSCATDQTGGGTGGGSWSTTTSQVAGQLINYSNNDTDIITVGANSTTSAEFWFDPNLSRGYISGNLGIGSTTPGSKLTVVGNGFFDGGTVTVSTLVATSSISTPSLTLSSVAINSLLSTNSSGVVVATSTPTFGNFNATSTTATSTISGGLTIETSGFVYDYSTNNVGIGTAIPTAKLEISGGFLATASSTIVGDATTTGRYYIGNGLNISGNINNAGSMTISGGNHNLQIVNGDGIYLDSTTGLYVTSNRTSLGPSGVLSWGSSTNNGSTDIGLSRLSSGVFGIGTGSQGDTNGTLISRIIGIATSTPYYNLTIASTTGSQLALSAGADLAQWAFRNAGGNFYLSTTTVAGTSTSTLAALSINGTTGGLSLGTTTAGTLKTNSSGLVWIDSSSGSSASSTLLADSNTFSGTNNFTAKLGLATTTPYAKLSVNSIAGEPAFVVGSSTATSLIVDYLGKVGIGSTSPNYPLDVGTVSDGTIAFFGNRTRNGYSALGVDSGGRSTVEIYGNDATNGGAYITANGYEETFFNLFTRSNTSSQRNLRLGNKSNTFRLDLLNDANNSILTTGIFSIAATAPTNSFTISGTTGNFGIGLSEAGSKLEVRASNNDGISVSNGSDSTILITPVGSGQSRIKTDLAGRWMSFADGDGTSDILIIRNGNVGIASSTPGYKLSVVGNGFFDGGTVTASSLIATSSISTPSLTLSSVAINSLLSTNSSGVVVATSTPTFGNFNATSTTATSTIATGGLTVGSSYFIVQQNSGNVGIGTTTPTWLLNPSSATLPQLALSAGADLAQWAFRNAGGNFYLGTTTVAGTATTSISALEISGSGFGTTTVRGLNISGQATTTSNVGINIAGGCFSINDTCLSTGGSSPSIGGTLTSATAGSVLFAGSGTFAQDNSNFFFDDTNNKLGLGTTTPYAKLSVNSIAGEPAFVVGSSTKTSFIVDSMGNVGIGTTTPFGLLSIQRPAGTTNSFVIGSSTGRTSYVIDSTGRSRYYKSDGTTSDSMSIGTYTSSAIADIKFLTIGSNGFNRGTGSINSGLALREDTHNWFMNYPWENYTSHNTDAAELNIGANANGVSPALGLYNWNATPTVGYGTTINFSVNTGAGSGTKTNIGRIGFVSSNVGASTYRGDFVIMTSIGAAAVEKARLTSTGYLGIGTSTPAWMLQIATSTNSISKAMFALSDSGAGTNLKHWTLSSQGGNFYIASSSDSYATTSIAALTILGSTGAIGIGTTTPNSYLSIQNTANFNELLKISSTTGASMLTVTKWGGFVQSFSSTSALSVRTESNVPVFEVDTTQSSSNAGIDITAGGSQTGNLLNFYSSGGTLLSGFSAAGGLQFNISSTTALNLQNGSSVTKFNFDTVNGYFGIGTTSAGYPLHVEASSTADYIARIYNADSATTADGLLISLAVANASRTTSNYFIGFSDGAGTVAGKIQGGSSAVAYTTTGADLAEYFPVVDPNNLPDSGEVVALDTTVTRKVKRADGNIDEPFGIVSVNPGFIGNGPICPVDEKDCDKNYAKYNVLVTLAGQVPLKVSSENGPIEVGDYLTLSKTKPGFAVKAIESGTVIGQALSRFTGESTATTTFDGVASSTNPNPEPNTILAFAKTEWRNINNTFVIKDRILLDQSNSNASTSAMAFLINQKGSGDLINLQKNGVSKLLVSSDGVMKILSGFTEQDKKDLFVVSNSDSEVFSINSRGDIKVGGIIKVSKNTAGTAKLVANSTEVEVIFDTPYDVIPKIVATPSKVASFFYAVTDKTINGFKIKTNIYAAEDIDFDWIALVQPEDTTSNSVPNIENQSGGGSNEEVDEGSTGEETPTEENPGDITPPSDEEIVTDDNSDEPAPETTNPDNTELPSDSTTDQSGGGSSTETNP